MVSDMREAFPEEYGGAGLSYVTYIGVCEMLVKYCASTSVTVSAHTSLCSWSIFAFGTEEQKQKYLVPLAPGEKIGCSAAAFSGSAACFSGAADDFPVQPPMHSMRIA